jgi:hypothetical protein
MAGGRRFAEKVNGWQPHGEGLGYELTLPNSGTITITIADCGNQPAFVEDLSLLTLDVMMGVIGQLCFANGPSSTNNPLQTRVTLTAKQIARYKGFRSHGKNRWAFLESINKEMTKLGMIRISVLNANIRNCTMSYKGSLATIEPIHRDFNRYTKNYLTTSWQVRPGKWSIYNMSRAQYNFIGKLNHAILTYDHREQRGVESYAKKLMYSLFVIPGGTNYLIHGAKKCLREYLILIGEFHSEEDAGRNNHHRALKRLGRAMDFLVSHNMITTNINGSVFDYIERNMGRWRMARILDRVVEIKMVTPASNTCFT